MKTHVRFFGVCTAALGFSLWFLASAGSKAADENDLKDSILKLAGALEKKDPDAKKQAAAIANKIEGLEDVMNFMKPRRPKGKGGIGIGDKPGAILPDHIEQMIMNLAQKQIAKERLAKEAEALERMGYQVAAIAEVAHARAPEKDDGKKKKKDWLTWSEELRDASLEFADAAKQKNAAAIKTAAGKMEAKCTSCHEVFRD